jgi:(2Fe-2S) ferredoxin
MPRPTRHVFVCSQQRPAGHPRGSCGANGASPLLQAFWAELQKRQAFEQVAITYAGCIGPCNGGPNVLVYPEGVLYRSVGVDDIAEIFDKHLLGGEPVARLCADSATW